MRKMRPLEAIQEILIEEKVAYKYFPAGPNLQKASLLVDLTGAEEEEKVLCIHADTQDLTLFPLIASKNKSYILIDYELFLPIEAQKGHLADTALGILFINRQIPIGSFQLEATDDHLTFRHSQMISSQSLDKELITGTMGAIMLYSDIFSLPLKELASGKISYRRLMQETLEQSR